MTEGPPNEGAGTTRRHDDLDEMLEELAADPVRRAAYEDARQREDLLDRLVEARGSRSQKAIADAMGTTQSAISDIENGRVDPRLSTLQRYARAVGRTLEVALRDDELTMATGDPIEVRGRTAVEAHGTDAPTPAATAEQPEELGVEAERYTAGAAREISVQQGIARVRRPENPWGSHLVLPLSSGNRRTAHITFERQELSGHGWYRAHAWGDAVFPDVGPAYQGTLSFDQNAMRSAIAEFEEVWRRFIDRGRDLRNPFVEGWDLNTENPDYLDETWRSLARAGHRLFRLLFHQGDDQLRLIGDLLEGALRSGEQDLVFHSDDLFAPWWMLYTPPEPDTDIEDPNAPWSIEGFWGYRHRIEHRLNSSLFDGRLIVSPHGPRVGLFVDARLDAMLRVPTVEPLVQLFRSMVANVEVRRTKHELAQVLRSTEHPDQVIYFHCHGSSGGSSSHGVEGTELILSDDEPIRASDLAAWLGSNPLTAQPLVFLNASNAGRMMPGFFGSVGHAFIRGGASCVIGPRTDLPAMFASEYATRFFKLLLQPGRQVGDITRELAREFAARHRNPLGLIYSIYGTMDTRLVREEGIGADEAGSLRDVYSDT